MSRAAIRYAKAILDTAGADAAAVNADMASIVAALKESNELSVFLSDPVAGADAKLAVLNEIFPNVQHATKSLLRLLQENKRFEILPDVAEQYKLLFDEMSGVETAVVTTAFPITAELEQKVMSKIREFSDKTITISNIVDDSIIGGFILRIGDKQYNASIASRIADLKREFIN